jgi:hypothetical protein
LAEPLDTRRRFRSQEDCFSSVRLLLSRARVGQS